MTRLLTCGFELSTGSPNTEMIYNGGGVNTQYARPRSGAYCFRTESYTATWPFPTPQNEGYVRFAAMNTSSATGANRFALYDVNGTILLALSWGINSVITASSNGGSLAATTQTFFNAATTSDYSVIEIYFKIADSGGRFVVRFDGNVIIDFTGDTKSQTTTTAVLMAFLAPNGGLSAIDDVAYNDINGVVDNSWPGDGRVYAMLPNGDGGFSQFVGSDGNSVNNSLLVDENPPVMTDYVESSTSGYKDFYALTDPPALLEGDAYTRVGVIAWAQRTNLSVIDQGLLLGINSGGVEDFDPAMYLPPPAGSPAFLRSKDWLLDPNGQVPWTAAALAALQEGMKVS